MGFCKGGMKIGRILVLLAAVVAVALELNTSAMNVAHAAYLPVAFSENYETTGDFQHTQMLDGEELVVNLVLDQSSGKIQEAALHICAADAVSHSLALEWHDYWTCCCAHSCSPEYCKKFPFGFVAGLMCIDQTTTAAAAAVVVSSLMIISLLVACL